MASSYATHPGTPHHIPGIKLTYGDIDPGISPYLPYTPPKSLKEQARQHKSPSPCSPHSYSHQGSSTTKLVKDLQEEINKLQLVDASRADVIIEQKIEIAVLKNDLEHARRDKEAVISSFGIVIDSITRGACVTPSPQVLAGASTVQDSSSENRVGALEKEIERYRKSDRLLRSRIQDLGRGIEIRGRLREREHDAGSMERGYNVVRRENDRMEFAPSGQGRALDKRKGKMVERDVGSGSGSANPPQSQQEYHHTIGSGPTASQLVGSWGEDLSDDLPIIPNSPVEEPVVNPVHVDVGMCSLEDFLDNEGLPASVSAQPSSIPSTVVMEFPPAITAQSSLSAQVPKFMEDERHIDEQIEENKKTIAIFSNMPTPGVIKTGFTLEGSFRGADYDKMKTSHPVRDFDRMAPNSRNPGRETRMGPGTAFETPKDKSFHQGLWNDSQDRNGIVEAHMRAATGRSDTRFPDFFRYGIQYLPADGDSNYLRTVQLRNLPLGTEVRDVLARVRGGDVVSAAVVKMGKIAPDTLQARVVFKHEAAAEEYVLYAAEHPISFAEDNFAEVALADTPTYPLPAKQVSRLREQTRCIAILNVPFHLSVAQLEHDLACGNGHRAQSLIEMYIDEEFTLHLQFANIDMAGSAWAILNAWNAYRGLHCKWEADPCASDVEELALEVKPRPKIFPENWGQRKEKENGRGDRSESENGESELILRGEGRKRLAALESQRVSIPNFSAAKFKAASWADEVNDELEEDEDDGKVEMLDEFALGGCGGESETSSREMGEGSKSASGSCSATDSFGSLTPAVESATPEAHSCQDMCSEASETAEDNASTDHQTESNITSVPHSSLTPSAAIQMENLPITVLTVDQELQAALLACNTNKDLANATTTAATTTSFTCPNLEKRKSLIGLAGSKYARAIPAFVDTGKRPRSIHINTSSSAASKTSPKTSPTKNTFKPSCASESDDAQCPQSNSQAPGIKQRFSASPPRVDLEVLIKSARSSYASAGASEPDVETEAEVKDIEENITPQDAVTKPKAQLFKWFQLPRGKKRGYGAREQEIDERNLRIPIEELRPASSQAGEGEVKVFNPDEIDLSDGEDEFMVGTEVKETVSDPDVASSSSVPADDGVLAVVQDTLKTETKSSGEPPEQAIERANKLLDYPVKDEKAETIYGGDVVKDGAVCS